MDKINIKEYLREIDNFQTLEEFCDDKTQLQAANILGITQSAVSYMQNSGRYIFITFEPDEKPKMFDIRRVGINCNARKNGQSCLPLNK